MTTNPNAGRGGGGRGKWKKGRKGRGGRGGRGGQGDEGSGNDGKLSTNSGKDVAVATKKQATEEVVTPKMNNDMKQRRGKGDKRGRGGRGVNQEDERSGNGKKSSTNSSGVDAAVAPKQTKKEQKVATPKMNNENNPPQAADPPPARNTVSFGKNTNSVNLKNALKVGVETPPCSGDNTPTDDQEMTSRGADGAEIQTEKKEKTMQEKLKEVSNHIIIICG